MALHSIREEHYALAQECWARITAQHIRMTTTTFVLSEVVTLLNNRGSHALAVAIGRQILESGAFRLVHIDGRLLDRGWDFFVRHDDKRYSLTDSISFVVMHERGIRQALTFDHHFAQAGFEMIPAFPA